MARPSRFSDELFGSVLERIAEGESLRAICREPDMPNRSTVMRWIAGSLERQSAYAVALEARADTLFDEILDIADDGRNDWMEKRGRDGEALGWAENGENARRSALRIDARKWVLARMAPKKYGDKLQVGGDGDTGPIVVKLMRFSDEEARHGTTL